MTALGRTLAAELRAGDLLVLSGPLGAGKTTLTRGIGAGLDVRGRVASPTFVLARTHPSLGDGPPLVHVDAYRLQSALELDDLDIDYARSVVVVEWGAGLLDGVAESWLELEIERPTGAGSAADGTGEGGTDDAADSDPADASELGADEPRTVTIRGVGPRWAGTAYAEGSAPEAK
ncbi:MULTISPECIES: tRNA (adenosine(37)-N6)-threonylcarbamoyltransferase complex ATPase subunit type 1 TsaE [unclassified Leifsonia]|uniref:tRNA (adenosine(37)-N6)-threonylcarbamoyltransferase complex ATPase subunit type 1 TsaE n=1 Tax=unclassified Leifsonia TaxID=2663824 RepID=UPI0006F2D7E7|nr:MULTISPECIES: tRNA (adenosine(37)-N6)-threonylcarbamoyltransferase complex ATPase subunit type 1 TsaE [unclassified Leifsonia]KQX08521.1 tRNA threonylcarbamoyladenosine biosynthesis protein TsaE [Leifsonia sp. Root1293]KRA12807.1 tRNA threonylcarbamoyladenosine biosynthesis protein TsaE [Leifsonia sp. Root60]